MNKLKYRVIQESEELIVITANGGVACIRQAESITDDEPRVSTTDYYSLRLDELDNDADSVWEALAEGSMSYNDWETSEYDDPSLVKDALEWLEPTVELWTRDDSLYTEIDF